MHEHTVELTTPLGPVTATFRKGRLTGSDVATVSTGRGFGICSHQYSGVLCLSGPSGVIRAAVADYATRACTSG
jgi:hypothetical protein